YMRFYRMQGLDVAAQPGYDTHGLPIEHKVEKVLNISGKEQIEQFGIKEFNAKCKEFATKYITAMNEQFEDLGAWMHYDKPYLTLDREYIEGAWYTFQKAHEKGFLYKGKYPVHVCPRCETAVAQHEVEFTTLTDPSIFVKFKLKSEDNSESNEFLIIWTTTPWTLPSNTGIMAHPSVEYAKVLVNNETWIMAKDLVESVMKNAKVTEFKITETFPGKDLDGVHYTHPLKEFFPVQKNINGKVVMAAQYVTTEEGTGLVHTAPGHGTDDFKIGQLHNLQTVSPVDLRGKYKDEIGELKGVFVKDADKRITEELTKVNALVCAKTVTHKYPKCWRCETPLLFIAVPQWFLAVKKIREKLLAENESTNWVPSWAKARFQDWINSLGDWPVSRQRYWGIPLPIWECESCGAIKVVGSSKELNTEINDLHRPFIDEVKFECDCGGKMNRIPDVLDVWFDSGVASWASLGFPAKTEAFDRMWPADLNIEGADQFRGWWNSEMIASVLTFDKKPFKNILFHGMVLDAHGNKFSKSRNIGVAPNEVIKKYGRDAMRLYLLAAPPETDFFFDFEVLDESVKALNILFNSKNFIESYCDKTSELSKDQINSLEFTPEDKWIVSKTNSLIKQCTEFNKLYTGYKAVNAIKDFLVNDLSRWYIKLIRERTRPTSTGSDKLAASYAARFAID
ncbi:MAG: isoleucine--tRNA ligase, partial [Candidatus Diapherotrites archaeon]|nr:isoleucine--tRNA ligase [Candidatus Diapherotrites archaeon]